MKHLITSLALLVGVITAGAQTYNPISPGELGEMQREMSAELEDIEITEIIDEPLDPDYLIEADDNQKAAKAVHFVWGADAGAAIDMSGNDMSAIELSLAVGMRWKGLKFLGLGVQADVMVSNSQRSYPIFLLVRTNFRDDPSLMFWEVRGGISMNYLDDNLKQTGAYFATGLGIVLAHGKRFSSHITLGYEFHSRSDIDTPDRFYNLPNLHSVAVRIGIAF